jgi:hypothetical protein
MARHQFGYQGQKFSEARLALMLPHPTGEARRIADAFFACGLGLDHFDISKINDVDVRDSIDTVKRLMGTEGIEDPTGEGTNFHRARSMTTDEKLEFSRAVDQLASWFNRQFWSGE